MIPADRRNQCRRAERTAAAGLPDMKLQRAFVYSFALAALVFASVASRFMPRS